MNIYPKTKHEKLRLTILLILLFGIFIYQYAIPFYWYKKYIPEEADIIFQSLPKMDLVEAIEGVTKSPYSHVGILIKKNDSWYVREAIIDVHDTPLFKWIKQPKSQIESGVESEPLRIQILHLLKEKEHSKKEMAISFGHKKTYRYLDETVRSLVEAQMIAYTIPDKPQSRLQEYRLTDKGRKWLEAKA